MIVWRVARLFLFPARDEASFLIAKPQPYYFEEHSS
jgi:hypothetical protein